MNLSNHKVQERSRQSIRLAPNLWGAIDALRGRRPGNVSRNTWITEAILEKLAREDASVPKQTAAKGGQCA